MEYEEAIAKNMMYQYMIQEVRNHKATYDYNFSEEECDFLIDVLEKADKYRWHDLRKYPEDLPNFWEYVLIHTYKDEVYVAFTDAHHCSWVLRDDEFDYCDIGSSMVKAWQEIGPFEVE